MYFVKTSKSIENPTPQNLSPKRKSQENPKPQTLICLPNMHIYVVQGLWLETWETEETQRQTKCRFDGERLRTIEAFDGETERQFREIDQMKLSWRKTIQRDWPNEAFMEKDSESNWSFH
jgi:hypothetical protein